MAGHARGELDGTAGWVDGLVLVRCGVMLAVDDGESGCTRGFLTLRL
jgi:hypothetical protein